MSRKLRSILLLDDNFATNYFHKKVIKKASCTESVVDFRKGEEALDYLREEAIEPPELMFVDINMPTMSGWEFLEILETSEKDVERSTTVILLSTSLSPEDVEKANKIPLIKDVLLKPLSKETIYKIIHDIDVQKSNEHIHKN